MNKWSWLNESFFSSKFVVTSVSTITTISTVTLTTRIIQSTFDKQRRPIINYPDRQSNHPYLFNDDWIDFYQLSFSLLLENEELYPPWIEMFYVSFQDVLDDTIKRWLTLTKDETVVFNNQSFQPHATWFSYEEVNDYVLPILAINYAKNEQLISSPFDGICNTVKTFLKQLNRNEVS